MRTILSSAKRRTPVELLPLASTASDAPMFARSMPLTPLRAAPLFLVLAFGVPACSTEPSSGNSDGTSSSAQSSSPVVTAPPTSADNLVPSASTSGSASSSTPTGSATVTTPPATAPSASTPVGASTGSAGTVTANGGSGSLDPVPPGSGGNTESPAVSLDAGDTSSPIASAEDSASTVGSEPAPTDSSPDREAGTTGQASAAQSCADEGPGRSNCGANGDASCCDSPLVAGGTYFRTYENTGDGPTAEADEATISSFRLDAYEVSVGRFRSFVEYLSNGGSPPEAGSGKHAHLNGGQGLADSGAPGSFEPGWDASWNELIPSGEGAASQWQSLLATGVNGTSGCGLYGTWTAQPGDNEELPITCTSWYESYAFCIWDGGFLPSEAEWKYAAAGGDEQRMYPWGTAELGSENQYAIYDCCYPDGDCSTAAGRDTCTGFVNAAPVGFASLGSSRYGQFDLIGNVFEWALDRFDDYESPCEDCALLTAETSDRVLPGAGFHTSLGLGSTILYSWNRAAIAWDADTFRGDYAVGLRCGRAP